MLSPKPGILDIAAYEGGRAIAPGVADPFKLSANESPLGPSLKAVEAFAAASNGLSVYPEGGAHILREAIGVAHGLNPDRIVCGNGSGELLAMLAHAYLRSGDEALVTEHGFLLYRIVTFSNGAMPVVAPAGRDLRADVDAMLDRVTSRTRIVFLDNPNNPTGTYLPNSEVRRLHAGLSSDTLLVIDAAYSEYVRRNDYEAGIEMVANFPNVVMTRTFSKIYALAGLRIGWAYCPTDVADALNRVRGPFNVSVPAQLAGVAAMSDRRHVEDSIAHNELWRGWLIENIGKLGLRIDESVANFVLVQFEDAPRATAADLFLMKRGLILRGVGAYGLPHCLRLTVGSEKANLAVVAALSDFQAGAP